MNQILSDPLQFRHHGLGMLQSQPFPDGSRIHFWHPDLIDPTLEAPIHTHRWDLTSQIKHGKITDELITLKPAVDGKYVEQYTANSSNLNPPTLDNAQRYNISSVFRQYKTGETYSVARGAYHYTHIEAPTITIVQRKGIGGFSKVLAPIHVMPRNGVSLQDRDLIAYYHALFLETWQEITDQG